MTLRRPQPVDESLVYRQSNLLGAVRLCVQVSGLDEKQVYRELEIDAGHWARIMKGDGHFPISTLNRLMDLCGNEIPLMWLAHSRNYRLEPIETETQRQLRAERDKTA